jgi:hypothetical protein
MGRRLVSLFLLGGLLAGCSIGAEQCGRDMAPETAILDATSYAEEGSWIEVCLFVDESHSGYCNEAGSEPVVSITFSDEHPAELRYSVTRVVDGSTFIGLEGGTYQMQCAKGTTRLDVGPDRAES